MDELLTDALNKVLAGLSHADNHYTVSANYCDILQGGKPGERWHIAQIWLHMDTAPLVELTPQGLVCDVRLNERDRTIISRILIPFDQIWCVESICVPGVGKEKHERLYYQPGKLNLPHPEPKA